MPMHDAFPVLAVLSEVVAGSAVQASQQFTRPLSLTLRTLPVGSACAIWSGLGVTLIALGRLRPSAWG